MPLKFSTLLRNSLLDQIETFISTAPVLRIYTGSPPAATTDGATGTLLAEMTLPSDWMAAASSGQKAKSGTWQDASANNAGTAGYFRILDTTGTTTIIQGTVSATGDGGDMTLDNAVIAAGQSITINTFTLTGGNA
jgi:hypothetical protein